MRCYTWNGKEIQDGITLTTDPRLGQVVFLGEEGRGRRYEKVALGKRYPAEIKEGRVHEAHPTKITLPPETRSPKRASTFSRGRARRWRRADRVCTQWCYTKNSSGS